LSDPPVAADYGSIHFWKFVDGIWVDHTQQLLTTTTGCLYAVKAIVADFNGDGVPDVFFACAGTATGEQPRLLLSQPDQTYRNVTLAVLCSCYAAAAADQQGNGYASVVVMDRSVQKQPFSLINNQDGTFTPNYLDMPAITLPVPIGGGATIPRSIYTVELIDFDHSGKYDLLLGGNYLGTLPSFGTYIFHNPGNDDFSTATSTGLPISDLIDDSVTLDVVYLNGSIYLLRTDQNTEISIQKINYGTFATSTIYRHTGAYPNGSISVDGITAYQGNIVSQDREYGLSVPE